VRRLGKRMRVGLVAVVVLAGVALAVIALVRVPGQKRTQTLHDMAIAWGLQTTDVPDLPRLEGSGGYARLRVMNDDGTSSWLILLDDLPSGTGGFAGAVPVVAEFDQTVNLTRCGSPHEGQVPSAVASTLTLWRGITREKVFGMAQNLAALGDPIVAGLLRVSTGNAARALYREQFGEDAYERLQVRLGVAGLHAGDSLPAFSVLATDGTLVDNKALSGHKAVLVAVAPDCGSCYATAVQTLQDIDAVRASDWTVTVVMSSAADTVRAGILRQALPASMKLVADPELRLIRTLWMQDTPHVVLVGSDGTVVYAGSCYDTAAVAAGIDSLAQFP
jgi:peroxiredoxin